MLITSFDGMQLPSLSFHVFVCLSRRGGGRCVIMSHTEPFSLAPCALTARMCLLCVCHYEAAPAAVQKQSFNQAVNVMPFKSSVYEGKAWSFYLIFAPPLSHMVYIRL